MRIRLLLFILLISSVLSFYGFSAPLSVARIFTTNMVLQQGVYVPIWGWANAGDTIKVEFIDKHYTTLTDTQGKWSLQMEPQSAGGPHLLKVTGQGKNIILENILIGEVWLASGQSNMNFSLGSVLGAKTHVEEANYSAIREFRTPNDVSRLPYTDLSGGEWKICSPATVGGFSAVAYFFARQLHLDQKVPVGIIHTSWSGTICEAWISAQMLYTLPSMRERVVREVYNSDADWSELHRQGAEKDRTRNEIVENTQIGLNQKAHTLRYNDTQWKGAEYPVYPPRIGLGGYKLIWFRKIVDIPASAVGKDFELHLGKVMTGDVTYFNGKEIGTERWDGVRTYRIPSKLVKAGKNIIAIRLLSEWGNGRLGDEISDPYLYTSDKQLKISLKGEWKYNGTIEPELPVGRGYSNDLTAMFNTKIAPLLPYAIKGFLWYQGEGNSGNPELYKQLQPTMITDWRIRFKQGNLPFLFVQLPNIDGGSWNVFREAQAQSTLLPQVGMAVSIDVGDPYDIHPNNKLPVGERLYLRAKEIAYGDTVTVTQGPVYHSYTVQGDTLRLRFTSVGTGLISKDNAPLRTFEIAADDGKYYQATATIRGNEVWLWSAKVTKPISARHAWSANPALNLYNKELLPATTFRTHIDK